MRQPLLQPLRGSRWTALAIACVLGVVGCSSEVSLSGLLERRGLHYREGEPAPFSGQACDRFAGGKLRARVSFRAGKMDGVSRRWYENGRLLRETSFAAGELHGRQTQWFASGRIRQQGRFMQNRMDGAWRTWDAQGTLRQERHYANGEADGVWREWSAAGRLLSLYRFAGGAYAGQQSQWHENGTLRFQATARGEACEGSWRQWHPDGAPRLFGQWQDGLRTGEWREWDEAGRLIEVMRFDAGDPVFWRQWHADGTPRLQARLEAKGGRWAWRAWRPDGAEETRRDTPLLRGLYPVFFARAGAPASASLTSGQRASLRTIRQLSPYPLYFMETRDEGAFTAFLAQGMPGYWTGLPLANDLRRDEPELCSTFMVRRRPNGAIFGHNNDHRPYAVLVLRHVPQGGYASISVVNVPTMNDVSANPGLARFQGRTSFLRAPFYPQEGMNERGVAISGMSSPGQERLIDPRRPTLSYEQAMRLVLDHAADVDEALQLLGSCNLADSHQQHLLVADASGRSAVVEYFGGRMVAVRNDVEWQVATNFPLYGRSLPERRSECWRYDEAWSRFAGRNRGFTLEEAMEVLRAISMSEPLETVTSAAYDLERGRMLLALGRDYGRTWGFRLQPED
jgi:antitoxin component YwqK of YwqJK toxin-antitoxin module